MTTTIDTPTAYDEIIDFLAAGITPKALIEFQPSEATIRTQNNIPYRSPLKMKMRKYYSIADRLFQYNSILEMG